MKIIRVDSLASDRMEASLMADSCIRPDRRPLFLPDHPVEGKEWLCEIRPAIRIARLGKAISEKFAGRYYSEFALVNYLNPGNVGCVRYDMMDDAVVQGPWSSIDLMPESVTVENTSTVAAMSLDRSVVDSLIESLSIDTTFKTGDVIILPDVLASYTPQPNLSVSVTGSSPDQQLLNFTIK